MYVRPIIYALLIVIAFLSSFLIKSFGILIAIIFTAAIIAPIIVIKYGKTRHPFLEGGLLASILPVLTMDKLLLIVMDAVDKERVTEGASVFFYLFFKMKLFIVMMFLIGGVFGALTEDKITVQQTESMKEREEAKE